MATSSTPSLPELILAHGIRNTIREMPISPTTLQKRMADPGGFTVRELDRLAQLVGEEFLTLAQRAKQQLDHPAPVPVSERGRTANKR